jgi:hypothetical protein
MELRNKKCMGCGTVITERCKSGKVGTGIYWGLSRGEFGDTTGTTFRYMKVACPVCGAEYLARMLPGKTGGSLVISKVFRPTNDDNFAVPRKDFVKPEPEPEPVPAAEPEVERNPFAGVDMKKAIRAAKTSTRSKK